MEVRNLMLGQARALFILTRCCSETISSSEGFDKLGDREITSFINVLGVVPQRVRINNRAIDD